MHGFADLIAFLDIERCRFLAVGISRVANRTRRVARKSLLCSVSAELDIER